MHDSRHRSGFVVGVDGSAHSVSAVRWAARDASMHNETLTLLAVLPRDDLSVRTEPAVRQLRALRRDNAARLLEQARQVAEDSVRGCRRPVVETQFVFGGPVGALAAASGESRMVVVGRGCQGTVESHLLGSVAEGLTDHGVCPVAVIPSELSEAYRHAPILLGVDDSPASESAIAIAFDEASRRRAPLTAIHASRSRAVRDATPGTVLSEQLAGWRERYPDVVLTTATVAPDARAWLEEHAEGAQMIVVGTHRRRALARMVHGSVSRALARVARIPLVIG